MGVFCEFIYSWLLFVANLGNTYRLSAAVLLYWTIITYNCAATVTVVHVCIDHGEKVIEWQGRK